MSENDKEKLRENKKTTVTEKTIALFFSRYRK